MEYALKVLNRHGPVSGQPTRRKRFVDEVSCAYCGGAGGRPQVQQRLRLPGMPRRRGRAGNSPGGGLPPVWRLRPGGRRFNLPDLPGSGGGAGAV